MRFVGPATRRLTLDDGSWIIVRERLSVGQARAQMSREYTYSDEGRPRLRFDQVGVALVVAYLVDWSAEQFSIRGASLADIEAAVLQLEPADFEEIRLRIERHETEMLTDRAAEKKTPTGALASKETLPSLDDAGGATSGLGPSIAMSMPSLSKP